ncbi:MAG: S8 family serine peptidase, partial [Pseudomonadota bacterium]
MQVAGTIGAETDNGTGVAGVDWNARIMPLRALGVDGGTTFDVIQAMRFAAGLS